MTGIGVRQASGRAHARSSWSRRIGIAATIAALAAGTAGDGIAAPGRFGTLTVVNRGEGQTLPVYTHEGRRWIVGTPGQEYALRVCNLTGTRVAAVVSVDGVNVVSGETAAPQQAGYVLAAYECTLINGWRKSLERTASFYFTELPDAYAARTGRPQNVGVIGVAFFPELSRPPLRREDSTLFEAHPRAASSPATASAGSVASEGRADGPSPAAAPTREAARDSALAARAAPAPSAKIGTGHGRSEDSPTRLVSFERASDTPAETVALHYDRRENLVAMGVLPPPVARRTPDPFPAWTPRFVPDPPPR